MKLFFAKLLCFLIGHSPTEAIVDVIPTYRFSAMFDPPEPNHGVADVCTRCHKQLTPTKFEYED